MCTLSPQNAQLTRNPSHAGTWPHDSMSKADIIRLMHVVDVMGFNVRDTIWEIGVRAFGEAQMGTTKYNLIKRARTVMRKSSKQMDTTSQFLPKRKNVLSLQSCTTTSEPHKKRKRTSTGQFARTPTPKSPQLEDNLFDSQVPFTQS